MSETTVRVKVTRDFKDEGTGESFTANQVIDAMPVGVAANYRAGGLVADEPAEPEPVATTKPARS